ncbi:adenylate kinase [Phycicoccus sp. BSK3Z-2]|uniref:Adenylate kinase n=1 Tax=Phycicoccus avicenniae TaxID=2828860 RepID=A0A941D8P4_9MICO|nr:adenylate kinase [Phycicoccus avicenniae]MBR7744144.1 adenylate kinase [Phycicoccus avicenniae]
MLVDPPPDLSRHRRIVLFGVTGSGKSTVAVRLAAAGGMPYVAVDDLYWRPGWVQLGKPEQVEAVQPHAEGPAWVMDGLWSASRDVVLPRADLVVALDFPRRVSLGRLLTRTVRRVRTHEEVCGGNTESWRQALSRDSIVAWHWRSFERKHREVDRLVSDPDAPPVVRFTDPRALDAWLRALEDRAA